MSLNDMKAYRMQEALRLVEQFLPLNRWYFKQSAQFFDNNTHPTVIYDSKKCRIRALYVATGRDNDHIMAIHYGRLEVPDKAGIVINSAQENNYHLLWHSVRFPLQFLDGLSPQEAVDEKKARLIREFEQSETAKRIQYEPEKILVMHASIWEIHGQQLFDIFDTRNQDLWERYSTFVREFWEALTHL